MDSNNQRKTTRDSGYEVANKKRQRDQFVRDKTRLQVELDNVTRQLRRDRLRLRDLEYAAKAKIPNVSAGYGWNFPVTQSSFVTDIEVTSQLLKEDCNRLENQELSLMQEIRSIELQLNSLRV